ncbi:NACHT, LRR and PYD domains-containing protein 1-like [Myripristis murdjan]|uniref:NACHT, LRR and PYD domains-containing protein 1-like n=1 Tax=Myripristis murdjan TaxID=586833 RepID=UPI0011761715|nr:NACHT, LRR and PYD domains-containing protein 1-like [Myripristis murdjan]
MPSMVTENLPRETSAGTSTDSLDTSWIPLPSHSSATHQTSTVAALPRSRSMPSLSSTAKSKEHTQQKRSPSLPDITLQDSFERFTPEISDDGNSEIYRFQCSSPGLYQCSVTGLVFNMEGEGDVTYRIVHWDRRLLAQHHKKPAGPLFDIRCQQQSVCQLHLPHCEVRSTGACQFLSVAHVTNEGTDFILPHEITETHIVINITGFSAYGNVKDEDSPPDPIRAAVLLFYTPPVDPDLKCFLYVLLVPRTVVVSRFWDVQNKRRKINADEMYIETPPHCKLQPNQEYTLSTSPEDESVLIQPKKAEFDDDVENYLSHFKVTLGQIRGNINLSLTDSNSSLCVWEGQVDLPSAAIRKPQSQSVVGLPPDKHLFSIRKAFIDRVSGPVLQSLLDRLLEKQVINDSEKEAADAKQNKKEMASFVIDTVRNKGERASSQMITFLCEEDKYLSESLGLM